tara:strand:- start:144 stop:341 length:198 start_codon:yes stop_codon:yes gene_type:complete
MSSGLSIRGRNKPKNKKSKLIAGHMTPSDKQLLKDHYNNLAPKDKPREAKRLNKMYSKYGMYFGA